MNSIQKIRDVFGLTQDALAQLLGTSLSAVKMAETGRRDLPSEVVHVLSFLMAEARRIADEGRQELDAFKANEDFLFEMRHNLRKEKRKLEKLILKNQKKQSQLLNLKAMSPVFFQKYPEAEYPSPVVRMRSLEFNALLDLEEMDLKPDYMAKMRIKGIEAILEFLENGNKSVT